MELQQHCNIFSNNCEGINSYVNELVNEIMNNSNITFLCETWQYELQNMNECFKDQGLWSHLQFSIYPEDILQGRPYGGLGFMCKPIDGVTDKPIEVDCGRSMGLQLINDSNIILNIIGAYMPFYNGTADQIALYSETLDILQNIVDDYKFTIVGDLNA